MGSAAYGWISLGRMDELGRLDTPVHRIDARAHIIATAGFIVAVMSFPPHTVAALMPLFIFPVALMNLGQIPAGVILRKVVIASPFAIVIGIFNPLFDREPAMALGSWVITGGWLSFVSILMRFALTVSAALTLVAITGMYRLASGLERLGVPAVFVNQLLFMYRYLFVLVDEGATMVRAVQMRSPGLRALPMRVFGGLTGHLLLRAMDRARRIHQAMVARGFDGALRTGRERSWAARDVMFVAGWLLFFAVARRWNLTQVFSILLP
jgi:cobalt/nickel transport system permease protein